MDAEDKLLGFKSHNYVSSSESEAEDDDGSEKGSEKGSGEGKIDENQEEGPALDFRIQGPKV